MASLPVALFRSVRGFVRRHWFVKFFMLPIWCIATLLLLVIAPIIPGGPAVALELILAYVGASLVAVTVGILFERVVSALVGLASVRASDREGR